MHDSSTKSTALTRHELWFRSIVAGGRDYRFPCDEHGHVDLDALNERARNSYFFARIVVGHEVAAPVVRNCNAWLAAFEIPSRVSAAHA